LRVFVGVKYGLTMNATIAEKIQTTCVIAGGGQAGMMLGFLLARAGVEFVVLEKNADFLRDFRVTPLI
jgi:ribulose 1,5-bisphosphate synthetase/thiazole synthase